jgi:hypothetical protein
MTTYEVRQSVMFNNDKFYLIGPSVYLDLYLIDVWLSNGHLSEDEQYLIPLLQKAKEMILNNETGTISIENQPIGR